MPRRCARPGWRGPPSGTDVVDAERLLARVERARQELSLLRDQARLGRQALLDDRRELDAAKYRLVVALEACIDAAEHVIASERLRRPVSFADAFTVLEETGRLSSDTAARARLMAGFRNRLVHGYAELDDDQVVDAVVDRLGDLEVLCSELAAQS